MLSCEQAGTTTVFDEELAPDTGCVLDVDKLETRLNVKNTHTPSLLRAHGKMDTQREKTSVGFAGNIREQKQTNHYPEQTESTADHKQASMQQALWAPNATGNIVTRSPTSLLIIFG